MDYQYFKSFYQSNILLFIIILFVLIYIIMNLNFILEGNYFKGDYIKTILITCIIFIISHMLITWDDNDIKSDNKNANEFVIPIFFKHCN